MKRGEIWWATLPPPGGRRPVLLVMRDEAYPLRRDVTIAPVTTRVRRIPVEVPLGREDGLPGPCVANFDSMLTIHQSQCTQYLTTLSPAKLKEVDRAIHFALGLENCSQP
jgi:mRNA interferase MazF